jgi:hypothetical protein
MAFRPPNIEDQRANKFCGNKTRPRHGKHQAQQRNVAKTISVLIKRFHRNFAKGFSDLPREELE